MKVLEMLTTLRKASFLYMYNIKLNIEGAVAA